MRWLLMLPAALLIIFFVLPTTNSFVSYLRWSSFFDTIRNGSNATMIWFTMWQAILSTFLTLLIGLPATWALTRYKYRGSGFLSGLITAPFMMPTVVVAAGVLAILPPDNRYGLHAILWAHVIFNVAVVVRVVGPRWSTISHSSQNAAATLGARPLLVFTLITWPQLKYSVLNAATLIFVFCFTSFGVITVLGGFSRRTIETEIFTQAVRLGNTSTAAALSVIQLIIVLAVFRLSRISLAETTSVSVDPDQLATKPRNRYLLPSIGLFTTLIVTAPLLAIMFRSVYNNNGFDMTGWRSLTNDSLAVVGINPTQIVLTSLTFAFIATVICLPCAIIASFAHNAWSRHSLWGRLISGVSVLPIVVSSVTLGLGLILTFRHDPFAWRSERWLIPIVHSVIALPLALRVLQPAVAALPASARAAAATLGASPWRVWWSIDLRALRPAVLRAGGMSVAVSLGEFGATSFLTRSGSTTLPLAIASLLNRTGASLQQSGFALAAIMVIITSVVMTRA